MHATRFTRRETLGLFTAACALGAQENRPASLHLLHFKVRVADVDRSLAFYDRLFGCPRFEIQGGSYLTPRDVRSVFLKIGSGRTYLILSPPGSDVPVGLEHLSLDRTGMATAARQGVPEAYPGQPLVRDPAGNLLEFVNEGNFWDRPGIFPIRDIAGQPKPPFEPVDITGLAVRVNDPDRAAEFYRNFGTEKSPGLFDFAHTTLELVKSKSPPNGLRGFTVAVRNFQPASARKTLRALGMSAYDRGRHNPVCVRDPDGNELELTAAS